MLMLQRPDFCVNAVQAAGAVIVGGCGSIDNSPICQLSCGFRMF